MRLKVKAASKREQRKNFTFTMPSKSRFKHKMCLNLVRVSESRGKVFTFNLSHFTFKRPAAVYEQEGASTDFPACRGFWFFWPQKNIAERQKREYKVTVLRVKTTEEYSRSAVKKFYCQL